MRILTSGIRALFLFVGLVLMVTAAVSILAQQQEGAGDGPDIVRFAVIGDFGSANQDEQDVADLVDSWDVDFIISTGDNYYLSARGFGGNGLDQYDNSVGRFYCRYLKDTGMPDRGQLDCPEERQSETYNRFFATIGNHDRSDTSNEGISNYLNYFSLPGDGFTNSSDNERYYDFMQGPVHFFALDSDSARRDSDDLAAQKAWLEEQLSKSTSDWNIVFFHQSAYSSASHGSDPVMQWPFSEWGADAVFQGHDHVYERIMRDDLVYFISGNGGRHLYEFDTAISGSMMRYDRGFGAMLVTASEQGMEFEAWTVYDERQEEKEETPTLIDIYHLPAVQAGCSSANVSIAASTDDAVQEQATGRIDLSTVDLAMVQNDESKQYIGLRFNQVDIPAGKKIHNATIEFSAREYETVQTNLVIYGQAADNAGGFTPAYDDIWSRPRTTASAAWDEVADWQRTEPRTKYLSSDLSAIVQEIVDRDGWKRDNGMAFIVDGIGKRTAYAYDHGGEDPAMLTVVYCDEPDIGDEIWVDWNDNGLREAGEPVRAGVAVTLWSTGDDGKIGGEDDEVVARTISGNQGYGFHDLAKGSYYVEFIQPDFQRISLPNEGIREEVDSDADPNTGLSDVIQFEGEPVAVVDAGFVPDPASISENSVGGWTRDLLSLLPWLLVIVLGLVILSGAIVIIVRRKR